MHIYDYANKINSAAETGIYCRCCGFPVLSLPGEHPLFCSFCEAYVLKTDNDIVNGSAEISKNLKIIRDSVSSGKMQDGAAAADALAAIKDPHLLFGASEFYRLFSDTTYYGVDYTLGGFMYPNAEKRSDETPKNKYNAVALMSKSKEFLFKALKLMQSDEKPSNALAFIAFMSNIKLKRYVQAEKLLDGPIANSGDAAIISYATMAFKTHTDPQKSASAIQKCISYGIPNAFYYLSIHLAKRKRLSDSLGILSVFVDKTGMPAAINLKYRVGDIKAASDI